MLYILKILKEGKIILCQLYLIKAETNKNCTCGDRKQIGDFQVPG